MAKTAAAPAAETADAAKGGRKKLVMIVVPVLLVVVAAWYFVLGPGSGGSEAEEKPEAPEHGEVVALDPITMNLADGRLLKVGLALQLPLEPPAGGGGGHGEFSGSVALDEAIAFLGEHTYDQLAAPAARQTAKKELSHRVAERYHHGVLEVYFTEFVMQ
jgi:flagellar FliL protein